VKCIRCSALRSRLKSTFFKAKQRQLIHMHSGWLVYKFYAKIGKIDERQGELGDARYLM